MTEDGRRLALIVAMAANGVIGAGNAMPWHLPADLRRFKALTMGHHIIMGRRTWESIGRALPGRTSIVVTRQADYRAPGAVVCLSLADALALSAQDPEPFVIGGGELFAAALPHAGRLYLTVIARDYPGDVRMPPLDAAAWKTVRIDAWPADATTGVPHTFSVLERVRSR